MYLTVSTGLLRTVREYLRSDFILFKKKRKRKNRLLLYHPSQVKLGLLLKKMVQLFPLPGCLFSPFLCQYSNFCGSAVNQAGELVLKRLLLKHIFPEVLVQFAGTAQRGLGAGGRAGGSVCPGMEEGQDPSLKPWEALTLA